MGKLYTSTLVSINGTTYTVEIWDNATTPTVKTLLMTGEGFIITRDGEGDKIYENPIRSSNVKATFSITDSTDISFFQNMSVSDEGAYYMLIKKGANLHWVGKILSDLNRWQRTPDEVFQFTVTSVDSLSLLKNIEIQESWFDSDGKILISKLIYNILNAAGLKQYWDLSSNSNYFFADALNIYNTTLQSFTVERIGKQKISINAFYKDFNTFTKYTTRDVAYAGMLVNCYEALEKLLINFNARITLENGMYWIYNPLSYGVYDQLSYNRYDTNGDASGLGNLFAHELDISTQNTIRPKWESFPTITHQPPVKKIIATHHNYASKTNIRSNANAATGIMTVGPFRTNEANEIISEAIIYVQIPKTAFDPQYDSVGLRFKARSYSFDGSQYETYNHANKQWEIAAGKPNWTETQINLPLYYKRGFPRLIYPYNYQYNYDIGADNVYTEFQVELLLKKIQSTTQVYNINFYGVQRLYQKSENDKKQEFTNTNNANASQVDEYELTFYDLYGHDAHGTILVDNNSGSYVPSDAWSAFPTPTHTYVNDLISVNGYSNMSAYANAIQQISGNWYDSDDYNCMKSLVFDGGIWIWQGGTFSAQSAVYTGEWLKIGSAFDLVVIGGEEDEQDGFNNDQLTQGVAEIDDRVNLLYEQDAILNDLLQYNVFLTAQNDSILPVSQDTVYNVGIKYNVADETLAWNIQELGKVQSLVEGTHDLDPTCELIICDSSAESVIINLPDPSEVKGLKYYFKKIASSHQVQLNGTIDGLPAYSFNGKDDCKALMSDGTAYWLVAYYHK